MIHYEDKETLNWSYNPITISVDGKEITCGAVILDHWYATFQASCYTTVLGAYKLGDLEYGRI